MIAILKPIIITFLSLFILALLLPSVSYTNIPTLIAAAIVLTVLQHIVRPALKILFLPINIITLGLFSWVINALILWLAIMLVPGFHIDQVSLFGWEMGKISSLVFVSFALSLIQAIVDVVI